MHRRCLAACLLVAGCFRASPPPADKPPAERAAARAEDETAIDDAWFDGAPLESEEVPSAEALRFAAATFDLVERHVYDPALVAAHGAGARSQAKGELAAKPTWTRQATVDVVNRALKSYGVSHLGIGAPSKVRAALGLAHAPGAAPAAAPAEAVTSELRGTVGIIRIDSFLVPAIRLASVTRAFDAVRDAAALLLDLRGNHGGSASSVVYTAQYVVGPKVLTQSVRTHAGASRSAPYAMRGFFPDRENEGSDADIKLGKREGSVEWWTPDDAPAPRRRPTFVLVDEHCASSCEIFAAAMVDAKAATILGRRTAGEVLAGQGVKGPWKGYLTVVPFGTVLSPRGRIIEGRGVEPDVTLDECAAGGDASASAACLRAALAHVERASR